MRVFTVFESPLCQFIYSKQLQYTSLYTVYEPPRIRETLRQPLPGLHLLTFAEEPEGPRHPANRGLKPYDLYGDESTSTTTSSSMSTEASTESSSPTAASDFNEHTIIKMASSGRSRG